MPESEPASGDQSNADLQHAPRPRKEPIPSRFAFGVGLGRNSRNPYRHTQGARVRGVSGRMPSLGGRVSVNRRRRETCSSIFTQRKSRAFLGIGEDHLRDRKNAAITVPDRYVDSARRVTKPTQPPPKELLELTAGRPHKPSLQRRTARHAVQRAINSERCTIPPVHRGSPSHL